MFLKILVQKIYTATVNYITAYPKRMLALIKMFEKNPLNDHEKELQDLILGLRKSVETQKEYVAQRHEQIIALKNAYEYLYAVMNEKNDKPPTNPTKDTTEKAESAKPANKSNDKKADADNPNTDKNNSESSMNQDPVPEQPNAAFTP